ncbi:unnamed protein product [Mytilus coruscus]|uniref:Uncharacterized protein n=1 Tax=Mytilus coruscus TaxID=42192 RepID=A0A6J7ZYL1_MYTCO|nr:unnamed protein product [Mytilus coruscus]
MHFEYEVEEMRTEKVDLTGKNQYALTCLICNYVCHDDCSCADDEDKAKCSSMDTSGNCTRCPKRCTWNKHRSCPFIIKNTTQKVKKINDYMAKKYEKATQKILKKQQILEAIDQDIKIQQKSFLEMLENINKLVNRLKKIALHPELVSVQRYIDFIITSKVKEKKYGFEARLALLYELKNCTQYRQSLEILINRVDNTRKIWQRELSHLPKKRHIKS